MDSRKLILGGIAVIGIISVSLLLFMIPTMISNKWHGFSYAQTNSAVANSDSNDDSSDDQLGNTIDPSTLKTRVLNLNPPPQIGPAKIYSDSKMTPGAVYSNVNKDDICVKGYSHQVRNVTSSTKKQVYLEYGMTYPQPPGDFEVDHLVPLELGGSNDIRNLWPEPANPEPGFHQKDRVETDVHNKVCSGAMSLQQAQDKIATDWYALFKQI